MAIVGPLLASHTHFEQFQLHLTERLEVPLPASRYEKTTQRFQSYSAPNTAH